MVQDPVSLLKQMIVDKSAEQEAEKALLMEHFHQAYESMKPLNIVKGAVEGLMTMTSLKTTVVNGVLGFIAGLVVRKFANGRAIRTIVEKLT